jgi:hypothetical protein
VKLRAEHHHCDSPNPLIVSMTNRKDGGLQVTAGDVPGGGLVAALDQASLGNKLGKRAWRALLRSRRVTFTNKRLDEELRERLDDGRWGSVKQGKETLLYRVR